MCSYCGGGSDSPPHEIKYSVEELKSFLSRDSGPVIEFYGGEPLLRISTMKSIMDSVDARFVVQTNGIFLDRIEPGLLPKFHSILVSIDGTKEVTDGERGTGVYDRVMRNVGYLRPAGYRGDVVARMTVVQGSDIFNNVRHLVSTGLFDHVHWQLSFSMFWEAGENAEPRLEEWLAEYDSGVSALIDWWVEEMASSGRVVGIVPFIGIMNTLLTGRKSRLRCGSGIDFFTIMPDGRISACPVAIDFDFSLVGSIFTNSPDSLCGLATVGEPCTSCSVFDICGGRCLFVNRSQQMLRDNGYSYICGTVKHLISKLQSVFPLVTTLINNGSIRRVDFAYPEFNNGCEIIP